jgi:hypothetical protein
MRGKAANSDGAWSRREANATNEKGEKGSLSPYFVIFSMQNLCFQDFAKKGADHPIANYRKQRFYRNTCKKKFGLSWPVQPCLWLEWGSPKRSRPMSGLKHYERHERNLFPIVRSHTGC